MTTLLIILLVIACIILSFFILVQKPKGGGLSGSFGSLGTQVMGVKQSSDIMEKGTWYTMAAVAVLAIAVTFSLNIVKPIDVETPPVEQNSNQTTSPESTPAPTTETN